MPEGDASPDRLIADLTEAGLPLRRDRGLLIWKLRYPTVSPEEGAQRLQADPCLYVYHKQPLPVHGLPELVALHALSAADPKPKSDDPVLAAIRSLTGAGMVCHGGQRTSNQADLKPIHPLALYQQLQGQRSDVFVRLKGYGPTVETREDVLALNALFGSGRTDGLEHPELATRIAGFVKDYHLSQRPGPDGCQMIYGGGPMARYDAYRHWAKNPSDTLWATRTSDDRSDPDDYSWNGVAYPFPVTPDVLDQPEELTRRADLAKALGPRIKGNGLNRAATARILQAAFAPDRKLLPEASIELLAAAYPYRPEGQHWERAGQVEAALDALSKPLERYGEMAAAVPLLLGAGGGIERLAGNLAVLARAVGTETPEQRIEVLRDVLKTGGTEPMLAYVREVVSRYAGERSEEAMRDLTRLLATPKLLGSETAVSATVRQEGAYCVIGSTKVRRRSS